MPGSRRHEGGDCRADATSVARASAGPIAVKDGKAPAAGPGRGGVGEAVRSPYRASGWDSVRKKGGVGVPLRGERRADLHGSH